MSEQKYSTYMTNVAGQIPFCPGCGHTIILNALNEALVKLQPDPTKVVLVTDIGCIGLADRYFITNAFHGLHGRSITYACGIKLARPELTVIAIMGDGAAGIGGAHFLNVSRRNIGITLLVANNFNYGMTGGQHSMTTPIGAFTSDTPWGNLEMQLDLCATASTAGAPWVYRASSFDKELPDVIADAIQQPGFAMVEIWELCTAYFQPRNKFGKKELLSLLEQTGSGLVTDKPRPVYAGPGVMNINETSRTKSKHVIEARYQNNVKRQTGIIIAGGAGQKVKSSATLFAEGAIYSGLKATQKDDYPITVQTGHSVAEIILSPETIEYTAIESPDYVVLLSDDGVKRIRPRIEKLSENCIVIVDDELELPSTNAKVIIIPFNRVGKLSIVTAAMAALLEIEKLYPVDALREAVRVFQSAKFAEQSLEAIDTGVEIAKKLNG